MKILIHAGLRCDVDLLEGVGRPSALQSTCVNRLVGHCSVYGVALRRSLCSCINVVRRRQKAGAGYIVSEQYKVHVHSSDGATLETVSGRVRDFLDLSSEGGVDKGLCVSRSSSR